MFQAWIAVDAHERLHREVLGTWGALGSAGYRGVFQSNESFKMKTTTASALDATAIGLSALCLVHCLALPVLALALPFLGVWARAEWLHVVFVCLAAPIAMLGLIDWRVGRPYAWSLVAQATLGLGLMLAGAFEIPSATWERPLTVVGGVVLATAHIRNWSRRHAASHHCA